MFKKQKKLLSLLLAAVMALSLAACGNSSDTGAATTTTNPTPPPAATPTPEASDTSQGAVTEEVGGGEGGVVFNDAGNATIAGYTFSPDNPRTITMWIVSASTLPNADNKLTKKLKDELGITLDIEQTPSDRMDERIGTMLAGGQYPDIIAQASQQYLMLRGGAFLRLDDLVFNGNYPLLADHVAPFMDKLSWRGGDVPDGLYIFPNYNRYYVRVPGDTHWGPGFWLQKAVLADAGYPDLTGLTPEGYLKLIEDYAAKNPEINGTKTIGFMVPAYPEHPWAMWNTIPLLAGSPNEGGVIVDYTLEVPKANIYAGSQYAYDWFKMLNEANQKGLVYPDVVRSQDDMNSLIATGAVLGFHHQRWAFSGGIDYLVQEKMYERTYVATMPTFGNIEPWYMDVDVMNQQQGMGISVDAEDPAMLLAFLEVMMTERWQKILYWGIEGEEYFVNDDGLFERTPEMVEQQEQIDWQASNRLLVFRDQLPKHQGFWPDGNPFDAGGSTIDFYNNLSDYDREFLENYNKSTWKEFLNEVRPNPVHYPAWQAQLSTEAQQADQQVQNTMLEFLPQLIFCDPADFDTVWEQYNAVLDMVPVEIYLEFINDYIASFY